MNDAFIHKGSPAGGLTGATVGFFTGFTAVSLFGPTANRFEELLLLSPVLVGLLVAMPSLSGSLLRIPFAAWVDTTGGRKPFLVLMLLSLAGMAGLFSVVQFVTASPDKVWIYPILLLLGLLSGCGIATFSVGISQVAYWFPMSAQGRALGAYAGLGNLAPGLFSLLIPVGLGFLGLNGAYFLWLVFLLAGTVLYATYGRNAWYFQFLKQGNDPARARQAARDRGQELFPARRLTESLLRSIKKPGTLALVCVYFTTFGGFIALTAWLPIYWYRYFDTTLVVAGTMTAAYSLLASAIRVGGGFIADRIGGYTTAVWALALTAFGAVLVMFSASFGLSVAGLLIMGTGMGTANAAVFKLVPQVDTEAVGGTAGWVGGLGAFGGFILPPLMSVFVETLGIDGYAWGFSLFLLLSVISLVILRIIVPSDAAGLRRTLLSSSHGSGVIE